MGTTEHGLLRTWTVRDILSPSKITNPSTQADDQKVLYQKSAKLLNTYSLTDNKKSDDCQQLINLLNPNLSHFPSNSTKSMSSSNVASVADILGP